MISIGILSSLIFIRISCQALKGAYSAIWSIFNTVSDAISPLEDIMHCLGYHQYCGGCSVLWKNTISTVEDVQYFGGCSVLLGDHQYCEKCSVLLWGISSVLQRDTTAISSRNV